MRWTETEASNDHSFRSRAELEDYVRRLHLELKYWQDLVEEMRPRPSRVALLIGWLWRHRQYVVAALGGFVAVQILKLVTQ